MKNQVIKLFVSLSAVILLFHNNATACTSFTVYVDSNRIYYGMNFDYPEVDMRFSITHNYFFKFFHLEFYHTDHWSSTAGMNSNGFFSSCQMLYPEVSEWHNPNDNEITIGYLYYNCLTYADSVSSLVEFFDSSDANVIHTYGLTLHDIFADMYGNAVVLEVGESTPLITTLQDDFLVMANFSNKKFEGQPYTSVYGVGADRYKAAYEYILNNKEDFDFNDGIETLHRSIQTSGGYTTQCSFLFDPLALDIYAIIKRDFNKIWRIDLINEYIETYSGFDFYEKIDIEAPGLLVSTLEDIVMYSGSVTSASDKYISSVSYPNPFERCINIKFELKTYSFVSLEIFDALGNKIHTLVNDYFTTGKHNIEWQPHNINNGLYYYRLRTGNKHTEINKIIYNNKD